MYADDIALVAESEQDLQHALIILDDTFRQWGMGISVRKTQIMRLSHSANILSEDPTTSTGPMVFHLRGHALEEVDKFKYLGSICSTNLSMQPETASRLSRAAGAYHRLKRLKVWGDKDISKGVKLIMYKATVQSTLLYACESWAVPVSFEKLEVFQMRCLRSLCGISMLDRISNVEIRERCKMPQVSDLLKYRRLKWLAHVARMDPTRIPLQLMISTMLGTGPRGTPLKSWNEYVRDDLDAVGHPYDWWRKCKNREDWRAIIKVLLDVPGP